MPFFCKIIFENLQVSQCHEIRKLLRTADFLLDCQVFEEWTMRPLETVAVQRTVAVNILKKHHLRCDFWTIIFGLFVLFTV